MAIDMPNRLRQIANRITASTPSQEAILYVPSSATVLGTTINYQGYAAVIRCCCDIGGLPEAFTPNILSSDTEAQKEQKNQFFRSTPKKAVMVYLRNPSNQDFEVGMIDLYNVNPIFLAGIDEYFSGTNTYGIQFGWRIVARVVDRGFGLLQNQDWVSITGYVEERSSLLQDHNNIVYNYIT